MNEQSFHVVRRQISRSFVSVASTTRLYFHLTQPLRMPISRTCPLLVWAVLSLPPSQRIFNRGPVAQYVRVCKQTRPSSFYTTRSSIHHSSFVIRLSVVLRHLLSLPLQPSSPMSISSDHRRFCPFPLRTPDRHILYNTRNALIMYFAMLQAYSTSSNDPTTREWHLNSLKHLLEFQQRTVVLALNA